MSELRGKAFNILPWTEDFIDDLLKEDGYDPAYEYFYFWLSNGMCLSVELISNIYSEKGSVWLEVVIEKESNAEDLSQMVRDINSRFPVFRSVIDDDRMNIALKDIVMIAPQKGAEADIHAV